MILNLFLFFCNINKINYKSDVLCILFVFFQEFKLYRSKKFSKSEQEPTHELVRNEI